jgi:type I restriction enzyme S subunit
LGFYFAERREKVSDKVFKALSVTKYGIVPQIETAAKTDDGDNRKKVSRGDFVINSRSDRKGSAGFSELDGSVSLINTVLVPQEPVCMRFVHHLLRSVPFQEEYYRYGKGIVADLWSTNFSEMRNIILCMPPPSEQEQIASFLDQETGKIDALITEQQRLIELLKEKRQAVISHAVTKGLNPDVRMKPSGVEWLGEVPEHWEVLALKRLVSLRSGETITSEVIDEVGEFPVFGGNGLRGFTFSYTHEGSFVLVGRQGALCGNVNFAEGKFYASEHAIVATPLRPLDTLWLGEMLRSMNLNQYSISAAQPGLSVQVIQNLWTIYPPIDEQGKIGDFIRVEVARAEALIVEASNSIALLQERRTALISAAVTGKIDVRNYASTQQDAA